MRWSINLKNQELESHLKKLCHSNQGRKKGLTMKLNILLNEDIDEFDKNKESTCCLSRKRFSLILMNVKLTDEIPPLTLKIHQISEKNIFD
jgi:hypothetical protein